MPIHRTSVSDNPLRSSESKLAEAVGLAGAIDIEIVHSAIYWLNNITPATLFGSGKVEELAGIVQSLEAVLVIVDHVLTPVQQRNLEKAWKAKVIDRTGLILEIFGQRASTREGVLQVQLAHLNYQKGRLVRSWTHLERQRGSTGFIGGPGETQIEADRRILQDKIVKLEKELEQVRRTRTLHRSKRKKVPHPVVAFVGYTNAGKSTLFNTLTGADVRAKDMLFATLDPTLRRLTLPHGRMVILSDTVGFISDLPTHLVAAFRATLEEVLEADLILHVRDMSDPDNAAQAADVTRILLELGVRDEGEGSTKIIEVWNKIDLLPDETVEAMKARREDTEAVPVSAITGQGVDYLLETIELTLSGRLLNRDITIGVDDMSQLNWLYEHAKVHSREDREDGSVSLNLDITEHDMTDLQRRLAH
ncbi:GTPase HflX [Hoeflea sp. CAU 1731]